MFHDGDLQSGIALAVQQAKAVLCFVSDNTSKSSEWESVLSEDQMNQSLLEQAVALKMQAGSQEAGFLGGICPIKSTPAVIIIKNARLQANLQSAEVATTDLRARLQSMFISSESTSPLQATTSDAPPEMPSSPHTGSEEVDNLYNESDNQEPAMDVKRYIDLPPSMGRMRLPNNAYDALRNQTQTMLDEEISQDQIFQTQIGILQKIPVFGEDVKRLRRNHGKSHLALEDSAVELLLRMPAAILKLKGKATAGAESSSQNQTASGSSQQPVSRTRSPANTSSVESPSHNSPNTVDHESEAALRNAATERQKAQRADYIKMQREREQQQKDERERIKAQIKADREERRRREEARKQTESENISNETSNPSGSKSKTTNIRLQVRTFDGSTLRQTFPHSATLGQDVRTWIDTSTESNVPYNLKLILTPLPNRNIEAAEEEQSLSDLGIRGSGTLVMVPVKGYVESYTGSTPGGIVGSALSGGYNIVSSTAGALFGGVRSILGYAQGQQQESANTEGAAPQQQQRNVKVRTLADQRAEEARKDHQFYNGNQLNFEPSRKEDEDGRKND